VATRLIRIIATVTVAAWRGVGVITVTVLAVTAERRGSRVIAVAVDGGVVIITVTSVAAAVLGGLVAVVIITVTSVAAAVLGGLVAVIIVTVMSVVAAVLGNLVGTSGGLVVAVGPVATVMLGLLVLITVLGLGSLLMLMMLAVVLGLPVITRRGLVAIVASIAGGLTRARAVVAIASGGLARARAVVASVGGSRTRAGVTRSRIVGGLTAATLGDVVEDLAVDVRDVLAVLAIDVSGGVVLTDKHVVFVHGAADMCGRFPDALRVVTGSFREVTRVIRALLEPLSDDHVPRVGIGVPGKVLSVVAIRMLQVATDLVSPVLGGRSESIVPLESRDTSSGTGIVVGLEAGRLEATGGGATMPVLTVTTTIVASHGTLDLFEDRVGGRASGEESESDSGTHIE